MHIHIYIINTELLDGNQGHQEETPKVTEMGANIFSHTHRLTMCELKELASGVFLESWKELAERRRRRRRRKRTKNNKFPGYRGDLNIDSDRPLLIMGVMKMWRYPGQHIDHMGYHWHI